MIPILNNFVWNILLVFDLVEDAWTQTLES